MNEKLKEFASQINQTELSIQISKTMVAEMRDEIEDLLIKQKNFDHKELAEVLDSVEPHEAQLDQFYKDLGKEKKAYETKIFKLRVRRKNLLGDSIIMALSLAYMGPLSQVQRAGLRKSLSEHLANDFGVEVSESWHSENENDNPKLFRKVLFSMGLESLFFDLSHLYHENAFAEAFFSIIFAPKTPLIFDAVGYMNDFLKTEVL